MLRYICDSRVERLQLQMRRLLRRLVAVRVKATNEINFKRKEKEKNDIPLFLKLVFFKQVLFFKIIFCLTSKSIKASDYIRKLSANFFITL